ALVLRRSLTGVASRGARAVTSPTPPAMIKLTNKRHGEGITRMDDFVILGGGMIGMSTAMHLSEVSPAARIAVLDTESAP
ncbi:hypothetical protein ACQWCN_24715, partial [Salmonella enterica subsp. enterica serovar Infantis]